MPVAQLDRAVSPFEVGPGVVRQVASAETFLQWCRVTIDHHFEEYMERSPLYIADRIRETLRELSDKVREGARVQAMGEVSLEVAASLFYF